AEGLGKRKLSLPEESFQVLLAAADGDGRRLLNLLENAADLAEDGSEISPELLQNLLGDTRRRFDKGGEAFYDQISALHKSVRGSNPDAALYWFARMLDGGCDPLYIARRVVRMASEEVGNADPRALGLCLSAWDVQERLGSPEGELAVAQAIVYLACAPKSNAVYSAFNAAMRDVAESGW
ncbi:recombination factor protein RarA, partial [Pseudomonas aeruginosa]